MTETWDEERDVIVIGSGFGGMSATLFAAKKGLDVLLCEKSDKFGGTSASSGGIIWVPLTEEARAAGIEDSPEKVRTYLRHELGNFYRADLIDAFIESGPKAVAEVQNGTEVKFDLIPWPDYHAANPGGVTQGRSLETRRFDGRKLGPDFERVRPPIKTLMLFGKLSVDKRKIDQFLNPFGSWATFKSVAATLLRFADDLRTYSRGTDIGAGNALIARLLYSLRRTKAELWSNAPLLDLIGDAQNGVRGAVVEVGGRRLRIRARKGVILAAGGFPRSAELRAELAKDHPHDQTVGFEANVGDALQAARRIGAVADTDLSGPGFWTPTSKIREKDGSWRTTLYGYLDRGRPGMIAVDPEGRRFVNESNSYHDIVAAMFDNGVAEGRAFHLICDRDFIWKRGFGIIRPFRPLFTLRAFVEREYIATAPTLRELAARIGVDPAGLEATVKRHNAFCTTGVDLDFGKGDDPYNRMFGDPSVKPNPNLTPIARGPFFAMRIYPGTLGTTAGLKANADAQVVSGAGAPIAGLYTCGNEMASIFRGFYPGGGVTLAPGLVFGYRAIEHLSGQTAKINQLETTP
jgi:3-oxosteroid 1-dehydrogenase